MQYPWVTKYPWRVHSQGGGMHLKSAQRGSDLGLDVLTRCRVNIVPR